MRIIDADALIAELKKDEERWDREAEDGEQNPQNCTAGYAQAMWSRANGIRDAIISIYDAPTIDAVEVVHGEWIGYNADKGSDWLRSDGEPIFLVCNKCHGMVMNNASLHWNFCPNCGAKMGVTEL